MMSSLLAANTRLSRVDQSGRVGRVVIHCSCWRLSRLGVVEDILVDGLTEELHPSGGTEVRKVINSGSDGGEGVIKHYMELWCDGSSLGVQAKWDRRSMFATHPNEDLAS